MNIDSQIQPLEQVSSLWFEDGNIVIKAGNRLFKVHRSILAAQSHVFSDMFSFPSFQEQEKFDDCPLVQMPDDPESVEFFLLAVLQADFFLPPPAPSQYHIVAGVLRISHKYDCATFSARALRHLSARFPCAIDDDIHMDKFSKPLFSKYSAQGRLAYEVDWVALLAEVDAQWCLPDMYLMMCEWHNAQSILERADYEPKHFEIFPGQKVAILGGNERLRNSEMPKYLKILANSALDCWEGNCHEARIRMLK
ncbi:hypothetical protein DL96DRAFT_1788627 [Flagelloscypha sp. PMI_526]|nr:hypothetical protein DL96DRAFT_1788627 [Flagelloscypha sp. PMI_526]